MGTASGTIITTALWTSSSGEDIVIIPKPPLLSSYKAKAVPTCQSSKKRVVYYAGSNLESEESNKILLPKRKKATSNSKGNGNVDKGGKGKKKMCSLTATTMCSSIAMMRMMRKSPFSKANHSGRIICSQIYDQRNSWWLPTHLEKGQL